MRVNNVAELYELTNWVNNAHKLMEKINENK